LSVRRGLLVIVLVLAGCAVAQTPQPPTNLGVKNDTTVSVTVVVNGTSVGDVPPASAQASFDTANLPPLPWTVVLRGPTGLELATMHTGPYQAATTGYASFDVSCGTLLVWTGATEPSPPDQLEAGSPAPLPTCGP
jgi:hypothetical protein